MVYNAELDSLVTKVRVLVCKSLLTAGRMAGSPDGPQLPRNQNPSPPPVWSKARMLWP